MKFFVIGKRKENIEQEKFAELGYDYNPSFSGYDPSNMDTDNWS